MIVFSHGSQAGLWDRVAAFVTGRPLRFDVSSPSVVEMIQKLNRLETVEYSLDKIVEGERQSAYLPDFLAGDKLLLVAHAEVIAGIDLAQIKAGDVQVNGDTVHVHLPPAQIFTTRIDNSGPACIPERRAYWLHPTRTWSQTFARPPNSRLPRPHLMTEFWTRRDRMREPA